MINKNILIIGYGRHGKDTLAEIINEEVGLNFKSSSEAAAEIFIFDKLRDEFNYATFKQCYEDRHRSDEMRKLWFDLITEYNSGDPSRLARDIMKNNDIYVGMRSVEELESCKSEGVFDLVVGIYDPNKPKEPDTSCKIDPLIHSDILYMNNGTILQLKNKVIKTKSLFTWN